MRTRTLLTLLSLLVSGLVQQGPEAFVGDIKAGVNKLLEHEPKQVEREGGRFRGTAAIVAQHWNWSPRAHAPRRRLNPRVAEPSSFRVAPQNILITLRNIVTEDPEHGLPLERMKRCVSCLDTSRPQGKRVLWSNN